MATVHAFAKYWLSNIHSQISVLCTRHTNVNTNMAPPFWFQIFGSIVPVWSNGLGVRQPVHKTYCLCIPAPIQVRCKKLEMQHSPKAQTPTGALSRKTQPTACRSNFKAYLNSSLQEATGSSRLHAPHQFTELQGINKPQGNVQVSRAPDKWLSSLGLGLGILARRTSNKQTLETVKGAWRGGGPSMVEGSAILGKNK